MIEIRQALHPFLKGIHPRTYFQTAGTTTMPYLIYSLDVADMGSGHHLITLDVDGWDRPEYGDTTALELLMSGLNAALNKATLTTDNFAATFYLDRKLALEDEDKDIKRRRYIYTGRLFERSV